MQITYDPSRVTYGQLLKVYFSVAHDPTELNRQGPDVGTQYRSAIFYSNDEQKRVAGAYIAQLEAAKAGALRGWNEDQHRLGQVTPGEQGRAAAGQQTCQ